MTCVGWKKRAYIECEKEIEKSVNGGANDVENLMVDCVNVYNGNTVQAVSDVWPYNRSKYTIYVKLRKKVFIYNIKCMTIMNSDCVPVKLMYRECCFAGPGFSLVFHSFIHFCLPEPTCGSRIATQMNVSQADGRRPRLRRYILYSS